MTIISRQVNTAQKRNKAAGYSQSCDDDEEEEEEEEASPFYCLGKSVCLPSARVLVVPQRGGAAVPLRREEEKAEEKKNSIHLCPKLTSKGLVLVGKVGSLPLWFGLSCRPCHSLPSEVKWLCSPVGSSRTAALCRKTGPWGFFVLGSGFRGIPTPLKCLLCWRRLMMNCKGGRVRVDAALLTQGGLQTAVARGRKVEGPCVELSLLVVKAAVDATLVTEIPHLDLKTKQKINWKTCFQIIISLILNMGHMLFHRGDKSSSLMCPCNNVGVSHGGISHVTRRCRWHILSDCCSCDSLKYSGKCCHRKLQGGSWNQCRKKAQWWQKQEAEWYLYKTLLPFFFNPSASASLQSKCVFCLVHNTKTKPALISEHLHTHLLLLRGWRRRFTAYKQTCKKNLKKTNRWTEGNCNQEGVKHFQRWRQQQPSWVQGLLVLRRLFGQRRGEEGTGASAVDGKPQMALITFLPWWASGGCEGKWQCWKD